MVHRRARPLDGEAAKGVLPEAQSVAHRPWDGIYPILEIQRLVGNAATFQLLGGGQTSDAEDGGQVQLRARIVKAAQRWEGKPYGFGMGHGAIVPEDQLDPDAPVSIGIDCSGLIHQAFGECGISIGGTAEDIYGRGREIVETDAQPGDLAFWWGENEAKRESGVEHVGIFVGRGEVIHAPHKGEVVKKAKIWSKNFAGYRNLLSQDNAHKVTP